MQFFFACCRIRGNRGNHRQGQRVQCWDRRSVDNRGLGRVQCVLGDGAWQCQHRYRPRHRLQQRVRQLHQYCGHRRRGFGAGGRHATEWHNHVEPTVRRPLLQLLRVRQRFQNDCTVLPTQRHHRRLRRAGRAVRKIQLPVDTRSAEPVSVLQHLFFDRLHCT